MAKDVPISDLSFETALARLETIVHKLETGGASLEESIALYAEGVTLREQCDVKLKDAHMRIEKLQIGSDGKPGGSTPFEQ
jgi:exodeoxyribonuclease VII small subunit